MCRCRKMNKIRVKTTEIVDLYFKSKAFNYFRQENCPKSHMWATNLIRLTLKYLSILPCCTCSKGWLFGIMIFLRNGLVLNRAGSGVLISQSSATIWLLALACEQFYERRSKRGKGSGFARAPVPNTRPAYRQLLVQKPVPSLLRFTRVEEQLLLDVIISNVHN